MNNYIAYRKPGEHIITQFNIQKEISELEFIETGGFIIAPFNSRDRTLYFKGNETEFDAHFHKVKRTVIRGKKEGSEYKETLVKALKSVTNSALKKVVVARQIQYHGKLNCMEVFLDLVEKHKNAFVYIFNINDVFYVGATPEVLIKKSGNLIYSASLAGTVALNEQGHFVSWSEKEYYEHKLVTQSISSIYEKYCDQVNVSDRGEVKASSVKHLFQEISGQLKKPYNLFDILKELHPTPAVAGLPTEKAVSWIIENEKFARDFYTGYIGLYSPNEVDLYVNLRCLKYQNEITTIYVGGGIVEGSTFESEFEETEHKAETLLSSIRKFHTIELEHN